MKIIIKNCSIDLMLSSQRQLISDSFSEYFKTGNALKNDGTISNIPGFNTYYKIPVVAGMIFSISSSLDSSSPYVTAVTYSSDGTVLSYYGYKYQFIKISQDGFISICCASRSEFQMAPPNTLYETINSDDYLQHNKCIKNDGTMGEVYKFYTIYKVPVNQGDHVLFSCTTTSTVVSPYCLWCFTDTNDVVKSYGTSSIIQREVVAAQDGYFSCSFNASPINGYVDIVTD